MLLVVLGRTSSSSHWLEQDAETVIAEDDFVTYSGVEIMADKVSQTIVEWPSGFPAPVPSVE